MRPPDNPVMCSEQWACLLNQWIMFRVWMHVIKWTHLSAGHSDFRPSVDVDATVSLAGDGAAHGVGDAHCEGTALLTIPQCHQAICCLSWTKTSIAWGLLLPGYYTFYGSVYGAALRVSAQCTAMMFRFGQNLSIKPDSEMLTHIYKELQTHKHCANPKGKKCF